MALLLSSPENEVAASFGQAVFGAKFEILFYLFLTYKVRFRFRKRYWT